MAAFVLAALAQTLKNIKQFRFCLHRTRSDEQKEYRSERTENGDGVMGGGGGGGRKAKGPMDVKVLKCEQMVLAVKRCISSHSPRR